MRADLREAGEALYGPRWQTDLAHALEVSDRTMRRWASGDDGVPLGVVADLAALCRARAKALNVIAERLQS